MMKSGIISAAKGIDQQQQQEAEDALAHPRAEHLEAVAGSDEIASVSTVAMTAISIEFQNTRGTSTEMKKVAALANRRRRSRLCLGRYRLDVFVAPTIIQKNGKTETKAAIDRST